MVVDLHANASNCYLQGLRLCLSANRHVRCDRVAFASETVCCFVSNLHIQQEQGQSIQREFIYPQPIRMDLSS